ncbi:hypothetical protein JCM15765_42550 [Paradesulfitobacterium aromaticivorans]
MDVMYTHCCGLDVHKKSVVACTLTPEGKEIRTFSTMTDELISLVDWLKTKCCTHVAMESTASYWKPIYNLMEIFGRVQYKTFFCSTRCLRQIRTGYD